MKARHGTESSKARCYCGRHMSLVEDNAGVSSIGYECPDCKYLHNLGVYTIEQYNEYLSHNR